MFALLEKIRYGLVVSCQAHEGEPLHGPQHMAKMALAAQMGGAVAVRANEPANVAAVRREVNLPIIGIYKRFTEGCDVYITPDADSAAAVIEAGADMVALDCTRRDNRMGLRGVQVLRQVKRRFPQVPLMAETSVLQEAVDAYEAGADVIATTLSGNSSYSPQLSTPDFALIAAIRQRLPDAYINAEGRISTPQEVREAFVRGADIVTVGTAITRPQWITRQFVDMIARYKEETR